MTKIDALKAEMCTELDNDMDILRTRTIIDELAARGLLVKEGYVAVPIEPDLDICEKMEQAVYDDIKLCSGNKGMKPTAASILMYRALVAHAATHVRTPPDTVTIPREDFDRVKSALEEGQQSLDKVYDYMRFVGVIGQDVCSQVAPKLRQALSTLEQHGRG